MNRQHILYMIFLGILATMAFILGASFQASYDSVMVVAILPAITVGVVATSGKQSIIPLVCGSIIGGLLSEQFLFDGITIVGIYITVLHTVAIVVMALVGPILINKYQLRFDALHKLSQIPIFMLFVFLMASLYSAIMLLDVLAVDGDVFSRFILRGFSTGLFSGVFGSIIFNSYYHDELKVLDYTMKDILKRVLFTALLIMVGLYIFNESIVRTTYKEMIAVLGILYFASAFLFAIRMLFVNNIIVIIVYLVMYYPEPFYQSNEQIFVLGLYLITLTAVTNITRINYLERNRTIRQLKDAQDGMEKLIVSTNNLFNVQDKLPQYKDKFSKEYLHDMFHIACNLYPKFDRATCYIKGEEAVEFVGAVKYDIKFLNQLRFDPNVFDWTLFEPTIEYETNNDNAFPMEGDLDTFNQTYNTITESLRFTVYIGEELYGGMSFDIIEGSDKHFDESDLEHFRTFQNLMNSYYSLGEFKDQEDNMKNHIILSILKSYNLFDQYSGYHSQEVAELASELGIELHVKEDDVKALYWAGLVHDIGKMGVPKEILMSEKSLSELQHNLLKTHPVNAFNILSEFSSMKKISSIVLSHHEWWNGTGYPNQLKAMAIPYLSQILHVADAVAAMSRDRVFAPKKSEEDIVHELQAGFGTQFSPKVVRAMIRYIESGKLQELQKRNQK